MNNSLKQVSLGLVLALVALLTSCIEPQPSSRQSVRLRFDWIANANFLGDFAAAHLASSDSTLPRIVLQEAGMGIDPIRMVITGQSDVGIASFEQILQAIDKGADLVIVGQINEKSPTVFITPPNLSVKSPKDLYGRRVGINPGGATEYVYRTFVALNGLDAKQIIEVPADYDLKGWINGTYEVRLAFAYVEPLLLDQAGLAYNVCRPDSFGVRYPGRFYFVQRKFLERHPDLVQSFIGLAVAGWQNALAFPERPIADMKRFASQVDTAFEAQSFQLAIPYYLGFENRVLDFDTAGIKSSIEFLHSLGAVERTNYSSNIDMSFVREAHANN